MTKVANIKQLSNIRMGDASFTQTINSIITNLGDGFYLDPSDTSTLFQNGDFTNNVTSSSQQVSSISNSTGFGHDLVRQGSGTSQSASWFQSTYPHLSFDNTDSYISPTEAGTFQDFYFATLVDLRNWSSTSRRHIFTINDDGPGLPPSINWGVDSGLLAHWRGGAAGRVIHSYDISNETGIHLISGKQSRVNGTTVYADVRFDGNIVASDTGDWLDGSWPMEIGAQYSGTNYEFEGDLYGAVFIPGDISQNDIDSIEAELASKVNLSL